MTAIIAGQKERVAAWICGNIRDMPHTPNGVAYEAIGFARAGEIIGGVLYTNYTTLPDGTHDIHMSAAGVPGWLSRGVLREVFRYPFHRLDCSRVTTIAAKANRRARRMNEKLGFIHEGTVRGAFGAGRDGILFGMLREECLWIK